DAKVIYHAGNVLFKSSDQGQTWAPISGDLTRNDKNKQKWSGGPITGDNTGAEMYCTIFAVAESPKQAGLIWAGSDDGLLHVTRDGGKTWADVTANMKGLPEWATVCCVAPSPFDADTAYVVVDAHRLDDMRPYLFKTADGGKTWTSLSAKLPQEIYLRAVREDPKRKGMLYLGTEHGVAFSTDDGATWKDLKLNLPTVAVSDLVVKDDDLVIATNGRSLWIFDDLTPLREMAPAVADKDLALFPARPAYRYRYSGSFADVAPGGGADNPPEGAILHYYLKKHPAGEVVLAVLDNKGALVRKLTSKKDEDEKEADLDEEGDYSEKKKPETVLPTEAGLHRVAWDLRYDGAEVIKKAKQDGGKPKIGPLVNPGKYTLVLAADGKSATTTIEVQADPRSKEMAAAEQLRLSLQIRDDITKLTRTVEQLRAVKRQIVARDELLKNDDKAAPLVKASKDFLAKLDALEEKLHNPKAKVAYDILAQKGGAQLYSQLAALFEMIKAADGAPPQGLREGYKEQAELLEKYEKEWQDLTKYDLESLNNQAKTLAYPVVIVPPKEKKLP
ncbi:MAG TPA: hypothetical protein DDY78_10530, partial [Planctomycetales bacterium]|nr:hypothetical protein [Planctomycetales bacterium]